MESQWAHTVVGGVKIPFIGIGKEHTEERCDQCQQLQHMTKVAIVEDGSFKCSLCLLNSLVVTPAFKAS